MNDGVEVIAQLLASALRLTADRAAMWNAARPQGSPNNVTDKAEGGKQRGRD